MTLLGGIRRKNAKTHLCAGGAQIMVGRSDIDIYLPTSRERKSRHALDEAADGRGIYRLGSSCDHLPLI